MTKPTMKLFVDLDPLVYGVGFSAQKANYEVVWEDENGEMQSDVWEDGNEKLKYFREHKGCTILDEQKHIFVEPVSHALSSMKRTLKSIHREVADHFKMDTMDIHPILILGGKENYRFAVAKQKPYKGNRVQPKPEHYDAIRKYLLEVHGAQLTTINEADDEVSIQAQDSIGIVATVDKDLDQIPGYHYDYKKKVFYEVSTEEGTLFFYQQAISGDSTDNIPGAWKLGAKAAEKLIREAADQIEFSWYENPDAYEGILWDTVLAAYETSLTNKGCPYTEADIPAIALETARLVKMQDYDDQLWCPPGTPDESIEEFLDESKS